MPLLELNRMTRRFAGLTALDEVSFELEWGEVLAVVGENGAGKSTLINILSGVLAPDGGSILFEGEPIELASPVAARAAGILTVHQEVETFSSLSLAENLALAMGLPRTRWGFVDWRRVDREADAAGEALGSKFDMRQPAGQCKLAQRQMARIAVAMAHRARLLLLDEPTSSLSASESEWLFAHVQTLRAAGVGILYISHRQSEIFQLADRIVVLRDGRRVWFGPTAQTTPQLVVEAMVGRPQPAVAVDREFAAQARSTAPRLEVRGLTDRLGRFTDVSLQVRAGEIVGVYGLVGAGRTELAQAVYGLRDASDGRVLVDGRPVEVRQPGDALDAGIAYVPEDRLHEALFAELSVCDNAGAASLDRYSHGPLLSRSAEASAVARQLNALAVRYQHLDQPVQQLSGGNQQKTVLARCMLTAPKVLILDEPTRGIDVGSKAELHRLLRKWVQQGNAVLMISSDLAEVREHADRVLVFREGRIAAEFEPATDAAVIATTALPGESTQRSERRADVRRLRWSAQKLGEAGVALACLLLAGGLALTHPHFLSSDNLLGVLTNASVWSILALGASIVIIAGGIDISIGAICAFAAAAAALVLTSPLPTGVAMVAALGAGLAVGLAAGMTNAGISLGGRIHPIVTTLGTMTAYRGLLIMLTGGEALTGLPRAYGQLAHARVWGINGSILLMIAVVAAVHFWQRYTVSGRHLFALGANPEAAQKVGINKSHVWYTAFGVGGALAALGGLLELAQTGSMQSSMGTGYELRAIAAAVIGGTAITGGRGSAMGVLFGTLLLSLVHNALVLWQVSRYHSELVIGGLILAAILWDLAWRKFEQRRQLGGATP